MYIYIYSVYVYVCLYTYIYTRKTVGSPPAHSVYLRVVSLFSVILTVPKILCFLGQNAHCMVFARWRRMFCAHVCGIRWNRICVCVSSSCFLCIASFYACTVRWVGVGLVGEENPPMPKWQECYTLPKSAPIGGEHVQDSLALHHNFMGLHTHIYICPRRWVRRRLNMKISNQKLCK